MKSAIAFTIAALFAACAGANTARSITVPYSHIGDYASHTGETEIQFLRRISTVMVAYSAEHEVETCGVVGKNGDAYALVLGTNGSHIGCVFDPSKVLAGYAVVDRIHSHVPDNRTYLLSAVDAKLAGVPNPMAPTRIKIDSTVHFSAWDFDAPGYLATPKGLLYEHGAGTETEVAP